MLKLNVENLAVETFVSGGEAREMQAQASIMVCMPQSGGCMTIALCTN